MDSFSLLDSPWLPTLMRDGTSRDVSLVEVFAQSNDMRRLLGNTPSEEAALLRLLIAILYRSLPTGGSPDKRRDRWTTWWKSGTLPIDQITTYLEGQRDRFDLFGATPFMQVADLRAAKTSGLVKLIPDAPDGQPFFTVRSGQALNRLSFAEAARFLVHCHAFDPSGIKTGAFDDPRVKGGRGYPIGTGWGGSCGLLFAQGDTLRETLLLNLVLSFSSGESDLPAWEERRGPLTSRAAGDMVPPRPIEPRGPADILTWPARRVKLFSDGSSVTDVLICNGDPIHGRNRQQIEPHCAWRRSENQEKTHGEPVVYMPRTHDPSRALWRGLQGILPRTVSGGKVRDGRPNSLPPGVLEWVASLVDAECLPTDYPVKLRAIGVEYGAQNSTIVAMIDDDITLPSAVLANGTLQQHVIDAVNDANQAARALADLARNLARAEGSSDANTLDGHARNAFETFYSGLDAEFRSWAMKLLPDQDRTVVFGLWHVTVRDLAERIAVDLIRSAAQPALIGRHTTINGRVLHMDSGLASLWFRGALAKALPHANTSATSTPSQEDDGAARDLIEQSGVAT